jgi:hypothetical protein
MSKRRRPDNTMSKRRRPDNRMSKRKKDKHWSTRSYAKTKDPATRIPLKNGRWRVIVLMKGYSAYEGLVDWCLTPTLAIFQLRTGRRQFLFNRSN